MQLDGQPLASCGATLGGSRRLGLRSTGKQTHSGWTTSRPKRSTALASPRPSGTDAAKSRSGSASSLLIAAPRRPGLGGDGPPSSRWRNRNAGRPARGSRLAPGSCRSRVPGRMDLLRQVASVGARVCGLCERDRIRGPDRSPPCRDLSPGPARRRASGLCRPSRQLPDLGVQGATRAENTWAHRAAKNWAKREHGKR